LAAKATVTRKPRSRAAVAGRRARSEKAALKHLCGCDPVLAEIIVAIGDLGDARSGRPADHYGALVRAIVGQQLSTKAARSIFLRLTARFDGRTPTPQQVLGDDPEELRAAAGLSEIPDESTMHAISEPWRPHRTLACRYLWRSLDNEPT
jgi:3-methyladenine DNA glycosylase/8-oxoguanine DNA glycosylase